MYTTLIAGLCAYVVNHPATTGPSEPMVVVGVIKGPDDCSPVMFMFNDSIADPPPPGPLGKHRFEAKIDRNAATVRIDGRAFIVPRWLVL